MENENTSARSSIVNAYFEDYAELFELKPYANLDAIAPASVPRGDYWAWKETSTQYWSSNDKTTLCVESIRILLTVETEWDAADFEGHAHKVGTAGTFNSSDIAEIDVVIAGIDPLGRAPRIERKYGIPVFVIDEMYTGPSIKEYCVEKGWEPYDDR